MQTIIEELKKLKLSDYPKDKITQLLNGIGKLAFMRTEYNYPKIFDRAVPNGIDEPIFSKVSRISITLPKYNIKYKRASTPNNTMFYAAVIPENIDEETIKNARITAASETCDFLRCSEIKNGTQEITFGKWAVKEKISLFTVVDPEQTYKLKFINNIVDKYKDRLSNEDSQIANKTREYLKFLSYEFSKPVSCKNDKDYDYMISAIFSEIITNDTSIDGVLYPSPRTNSEGLCVAIHPKSMHKIELIKVIQSRITKINGSTIIENMKYCEVNPPNSDFDLKDL